MTSYFDGATQHLTASALRQWNNKSAGFNGSHVLVELIAEPNSTAAHVTIEGVMMIEQFIDEDRSICGSTDDRALSYENRDARALPIGCSAWIIDDPNHTLLTAGHCTEGGIGDVAVIEFNVPLSDANGNLQHPGPEDQYASDVESLQSHYSTIGNDWAYFGCFPNTETGLTPYQAQNDYYVLSSAAPAVNGQQITITGFGSTSSPVSPTYNQAQKTHTGPYAQLNGTSIAYQTDTSGGNSGSAVLNESTGEAIGIHTNAGCSSNGAENWGSYP
jgi:V8-like Glu-specific endopeptidase